MYHLINFVMCLSFFFSEHTVYSCCYLLYTRHPRIPSELSSLAKHYHQHKIQQQPLSPTVLVNSQAVAHSNPNHRVIQVAGRNSSSGSITESNSDFSLTSSTTQSSQPSQRNIAATDAGYYTRMRGNDDELRNSRQPKNNNNNKSTFQKKRKEKQKPKESDYTDMEFNRLPYGDLRLRNYDTQY